MLAANSALQSQLTCSQFLAKWFYWLSLNTWPFKYKYSVHSHNIHSLAAINYSTSPRRNSQPSSHQYSGNIQRLFIDYPKIIKAFFACRNVLAANLQPENIQRLSRLQNCLSRRSTTTRKYSKTFACKIFLAANQQYPGNIQRFSGQQKQYPSSG